MEYTVKQKIQNIYAALRPSEQKAAEYILSYQGSPEELLIEVVAKEAGISQPTVIRFVKAAGYKGFKDLKYEMIQEQTLHKKKVDIEKMAVYMVSRFQEKKVWRKFQGR